MKLCVVYTWFCNHKNAGLTVGRGKKRVNDDLAFSPFHHYIIEEANKNVIDVFMTNTQLFPYSALLHHIPRKHLVTGLRYLILWCRRYGAKIFFHTVHSDILSVVFVVTKEGAWQTVLQHGEGRPEGPQ